MKYKWKDKVRIKSKKELECISEVTDDMLKNGGTIMTIACLVEDADGYIMKEDGDFHFLWSDEMIEGLVEEENEKKLSNESWRYKNIFDNSQYPQSFECPDGYIFKDENGNVINATKIVLEKKKKEYPKTYEECLKILGFTTVYTPKVEPMFDYDDDIVALQKLKNCRNAYWKIAGEEMGLGKPWEPDWTKADERKYCIVNTEGNITKWVQKTTNKILAFPTEEMGDAFKENFDPDIEICKELL